jgi:hypothetical protein
LHLIITKYSEMAPVNKPKHKGKALVAGATAGILGEKNICFNTAHRILDLMPMFFF